MDTANDTKSLVEAQSTEVGIHTPKTTIRTPDKNISNKILRMGEWIAFDFVRSGLGDRDTYGTKVFFETMTVLGMLEKEGNDYVPTNKALEKYPLWFVQESTTKKWGMRPSIREEFEDEFIFPVYAPMAARILSIRQSEKRDAQNAKARAKRQADKAQQKIDELTGSLF